MKILDEIHVMGRSSLNGSVSIQGSKNAALPMMAASLMHKAVSYTHLQTKTPELSHDSLLLEPPHVSWTGRDVSLYLRHLSLIHILLTSSRFDGDYVPIPT